MLAFSSFWTFSFEGLDEFFEGFPLVGSILHALGDATELSELFALFEEDASNFFFDGLLCEGALDGFAAFHQLDDVEAEAAPNDGAHLAFFFESECRFLELGIHDPTTKEPKIAAFDFGGALGMFHRKRREVSRVFDRFFADFVEGLFAFVDLGRGGFGGQLQKDMACPDLLGFCKAVEVFVVVIFEQLFFLLKKSRKLFFVEAAVKINRFGVERHVIQAYFCIGENVGLFDLTRRDHHPAGDHFPHAIRLEGAADEVFVLVGGEIHVVVNDAAEYDRIEHSVFLEARDLREFCRTLLCR